MLDIIYDLETDGLLEKVTKIHCCNMIDRADGKHLRFNEGFYADGTKTKRDGDLKDALSILYAARKVYGQNIIKYDNAVWAKLVDPEAIERLAPKSFDTRVAAAVIWTNLAERDVRAVRSGELPQDFAKKGLIGRNSLEAWGFRLGFPKGDSGVVDNDWSKFTLQMDDYCAQDNNVVAAWLDLIESKNYSAECLDLEHRTAVIIAEQERFGFAFDVPAAEVLTAKLQVKRAELEAGLVSIFPPWEVVKKDAIAKVNNKKLGRIKGERYVVTAMQVFNPSSRDHIADRLMKLRGWKPVAFTDGGKPQVDETVLASLPYPEAGPLAEYMMVTKRLGQVAEGPQAWLKQVKADGRMHGTVDSNGAVTGRMTHSKPNVAQCPKASPDVPYGVECRSLFIAPPGKVLVGCDAEGIELRMLGHYMAAWDDGAYADAVVNGKKSDETDVHNVNKRAIGIRTRDGSKTFIYAFIYGAGDFKLGTIIYEDFLPDDKAVFLAKHKTQKARDRALAVLGREARAKLMRGLPALAKFIEKVKDTAKKRGYLVGLDGRLLHIRGEHAAANTLLQSGGAVVMKKALVILDEAIRSTPRLKGRVNPVANIHDEYQLETYPEIAEEVGKLAAGAIRLAGEHFGLHCPLAGSYESAANWAGTH